MATFAGISLGEAPNRIKRCLNHVRMGASYLALYMQLNDLGSICILVLGIVCAIGAGVPLPLMAVVFRDIIESFPPPEDQLNEAVVKILAISTAYFAMTWIWTVCWGLVGNRISSRLQESLVQKLLGLDMSFFDTESVDLTSILTADTQSIQRGTSEKVGLFVQSISYFVATFITGFILSPPLTGVIFAAVVPTILILVTIGSTLVSKNSKIAGKYTERAASVAEQAVKTVQVVQAFGAAGILGDSHARTLHHAKHYALRKSIVSAILLASIYFVCYSTNALAFFWGMKVGGSSGTIYAVVFLILDTSFVFTQVGPFIQTISMASGAGEKILDLINQPRPKIDSYMQHGLQVTPELFLSDLVCDGLSFSYPTRKEHLVLRNVSLSFKPGSTTGIVGLSGSGKSSLVGLLLRLYDPDAGCVKFGDFDISQVNLKSWRMNIALVDQEPALFSGSVLENIRRGIVDNGILEEEEIRVRCREAAKMANADFVDDLENGIDSLVGSAAGNLSGGQRQRICLARALVRRPRILVLDEPTSALDSTSERKILEALWKVAGTGCTIIMIAHRLSTIKDMDNIVVMSHGQIQEQGTHQSLIAKDEGAYKSLVEAQNIGLVSTAATPQETLSPPSILEFAVNDAGQVNGLEPQIESRLPPVYIPGLVPLQAPDPATGHTLSHSGLQWPQGRTDQSKSPSTNKEDLKELSSWQILLRCQELNDRHKTTLLILGLCASSVMGALIVYEAIVFGHLVTLLQTNNGTLTIIDEVKFYCLMFFVISLIALFASATSNACFGIVSESLLTQIRDKALRTVLRQDQSFFQTPEHSAHRLIASISSDANHIAGLSGTIAATLFSVCVNLVAGAVVALVSAWSVALVLFSVVPAIVLAGYLRITILTKFEKRHHESFKHAAALASEAIQNIRTVAAFGCESAILDQYKATIARPYAHNFRFFILGDLALTLSYCIVFFTYALAYWWGSRQVREGHISELEFFTMLPAFLLTAQQSSQLFSAAPELLQARMAAQRLFKILDRKPVIMSNEDTDKSHPMIVSREKQDSIISIPISSSTLHDSDVNSKRTSDELASTEMAAHNDFSSSILPLPVEKPFHDWEAGASITFSHVSHIYPNKALEPVLSDINFQIHGGSTVGIVGPSGAGKSSLVALIERFYDPVVGSILVNGIDIREIPIDSYRDMLSYVPQEPSLFEGSIAYNIQIGASHANDTGVPDLNEIERLCKHYKLHNFISSLPEGYATEVGAGGNRLSGGQRQRIALARALIRQPKILILDEATSALDAHSEDEVQQILEQVKSERITIVMIAHRMVTIRNADDIIVLDKGSIVERGRHKELVQSNGTYSQMVKAQDLG